MSFVICEILELPNIFNQFEKIARWATAAENLVILGAPVGNSVKRRLLCTKIGDIRNVSKHFHKLDDLYAF